MSKREKLLSRLFDKPADFRWGELKSLLGGYGFKELKRGGSRRVFISAEHDCKISLHEPHGKDPMKLYAVEIVIEKLIELGIQP